MNVYEVPFALLTFAALVAVMVPAVWYVNQYASGYSPATRWIATMILPAIVVLTLVSWLEPG